MPWGGTPLLALNITLFPSKDIPLGVLGRILEGSQDKINESGLHRGRTAVRPTQNTDWLTVHLTNLPERRTTPGQLLI